MKWMGNFLVGVLALLVAGCATRDVNPAGAKPGFGYVDLFTVPRTESWWKVEVFDAGSGGYREFMADFKTPREDILRVEAKPGRHRARVTFVNRFVEAPAEVEVEVRAGMVTPVAVAVATGGALNVHKVEDKAGGALRNKVEYQPETVWKITATARAPLPYAPKAQMGYWK